jgi:hypothetical protein
VVSTASAHSLQPRCNAYWVLAGVALGPGTAESVPRALTALFTVVAVQFVVLVCVGMAAQARLARLRTRCATWFNVFQNNVLFTALVLVFGFVPLFLFRHLEPLNLRRSWESAFALGPALTFVGGLLMMALTLNYGHLRRMAKQARRPGYDDMPIAALKSHITLQNRLGVLLAATTLVGLANGLQEFGTCGWCCSCGTRTTGIARNRDGGGGGRPPPGHTPRSPNRCGYSARLAAAPNPAGAWSQRVRIIRALGGRERSAHRGSAPRLLRRCKI